MDFKEEIYQILKNEIEISKDMIEIPPDSTLGDYAVPMFKYAKILRNDPKKIAEDLATRIKPNEFITSILNKGPYLNFFVNKQVMAKDILTSIIEPLSDFHFHDEGEEKSIVIDYSSPNIAKPFGIAHILSTVIGNALYEIYKALGYKVWRINHLGDWGTQFGKLMVAYTEWGEKNHFLKGGIDYLAKIYVEFGDAAKKDPLLNDHAREWFKKLEDGDSEAVDLWQQFKDISLKEFKKYYDILGVEFDHYQGESFYNDKIEDAINFVNKHVKTEISDGALIVDLNSKYIKTPLLLRKSDGATTYHARDIAAALYRLETFIPAKILYVVGMPQAFHFKQLFTVMGMIGEDSSKFEHIQFGNMSYEGKMMSTRSGNFIPLNDVIDKSIKLAGKKIEEKNPDLKNKEQVAKQVGIGAVKFAYLLNDRTRNIDFTWKKALNFEGESAPYLQYTHARICSIKRKVPIEINADCNFSKLTEPVEHDLAKKIGQYPDQIIEAANANKPSIIANFLLEVAQLFNKFYNKCRIKGEEVELQKVRLLLAECTRIIIEKGLGLLGIEGPQEM
jgi:arginyl-tRNA synthetase